MPQPHSASVLPLWISLLIAAGSGALTNIAFPPADLWPMVFFCYGAFIVTLIGRSWWSGMLTAYVYGLGFFAVQVYWAGTYTGYLEAWVALVMVAAGYFALFGLAASMFLNGWLKWGPAGRWRTFGGSAVLSSLWVGQEWLRSLFPWGGFPWGRAGFSQADSPLAGLAWFGGIPLVSWVVFWISGLLVLFSVQVILLFSDSATQMKKKWPVPTITAAVIALLICVGLTAPLSNTAEAGTSTVAAVQGNVPRPGLGFNKERRAVLDMHAEESRRLAKELEEKGTSVDFVVWPENASDIGPLNNADAYAILTNTARAFDAPLIAGAPQYIDDKLYNMTFLWDPQQGPVDTYTKQHPVPFGEYIPWRSFFRMLTPAVDLVPTDMVPGTETGVMNIDGTLAGIIICFEVAYDQLIADTVNEGAQILLVQTNNAQFGYTSESVQQLAMSKLRAIETGRSVVHDSTVGVSAIYLPDGTEVMRTGHYTQESMVAELPLRTSKTPAVLFGTAIQVALVLFGFAGIGLIGFNRFVTSRKSSSE